jgi:hypothetical protein
VSGLLERAKAAINALFSDTSQTQDETREQLTELREEIDSCLAALDEL